MQNIRQREGRVRATIRVSDGGDDGGDKGRKGSNDEREK